jgi:hypothetical protein
MEKKYQYLDFTRQVFANNEEKSLEFDDVAVQMSITLCYELSIGSEPNSNLWIDMPGEIERGLSKYRATPFVGILLGIPAWRATVTVDIVVEKPCEPNTAHPTGGVCVFKPLLAWS